MKKITILMFALIAFWSCEKKEITLNESADESYVESVNPLDYVVVNNNRLVFADSVHFINCLNAISELTKEELDLWETNLGFKSYRTYSNNILNKEWEEFMIVSEAGGNADELTTTVLTEMPVILSTLTNIDCEYQVGEKIIWLNNECEYIINSKNEDLLVKLKQDNFIKDSNEEVLIHKITKTYAKINEEHFDDNTKDWQDARYQYQFVYGDHEYKFVFECCTWDLYYTGVLQVRNKFEYKKGSSWPHAGELVYRYTNVNVTYNYQYYVPTLRASSYSSQDLIIERTTQYPIFYIRVEGTMSAWTNNNGIWPITFSYNITNAIMWNQSVN